MTFGRCVVLLGIGLDTLFISTEFRIVPFRSSYFAPRSSPIFLDGSTPTSPKFRATCIRRNTFDLAIIAANAQWFLLAPNSPPPDPCAIPLPCNLVIRSTSSPPNPIHCHEASERP